MALQRKWFSPMFCSVGHLVYQGPRSTFSSEGAKEESGKGKFFGGERGGGVGGLLVGLYSISLK